MTTTTCPSRPTVRRSPAGLALLLSSLLATGHAPAGAAEQTLSVAIRESASTCHTIDDQLHGPECTLARRLSAEIGRELAITLVATGHEARKRVLQGDADVAITGAPFLAEDGLRPGPGYYRTTHCLVYRYGDGRPRSIGRLQRGKLVVPDGSHHQRLLNELKGEHPALAWDAPSDVGPPEILRRVWAGEVRYTLVDSHELTLYQQYYPSLRCARVLVDNRTLNWTLSGSANPELDGALAGFFARQRDSGELKRLMEHHLGHSDNLDFVSASRFARDIGQRLPRYRKWFEQAAKKYGLDWRLLAAIGYQESHWNPRGVSPTGVRGLMMLTKDTARQMGVGNRENARQAIFGGARYFKRVKGKIPRRIREPDRSWLALAAYNLGFGHLEDGRILTQRHGGDPDRWSDVERRLPLLEKKKFYRSLKRGRARGREAVRYVANIRSYYDILRWKTGSREAQRTLKNSERLAQNAKPK